MPETLAKLLASMDENKRYIELILSQTGAQAGIDDMDVLARCPAAQLSSLLNNLHHLTRSAHQAVEAVMRTQKKICTLQSVAHWGSADKPSGETKTYLLDRTEIEQLCIELVRGYEKRFGLSDKNFLRWYSDSGDTVIERSCCFEGQDLLGLVQNLQAAESLYTLKYRNQVVANFQQSYWPEYQEPHEKEKKLTVPRAAYFDLLAYHKLLGTDWYKRLYAFRDPDAQDNEKNTPIYHAGGAASGAP